MSLFVPKRTMETKPEAFGVCLWKFPDGSYLQDNEGNYFSSQGRPFDKQIEARMTNCVYREFGAEVPGKPFWLPGFRKISDMEHDDQMDNLLSGSTPDSVDLVRGLDG